MARSNHEEAPVSSSNNPIDVAVTSSFGSLEPFERWGMEPGLSLLRAIKACSAVLSHVAVFAPWQAAETGGVELVMDRLREDARRVFLLADIIRRCSPPTAGQEQQSHAGDGPARSYPALWVVVAERVKADVATLTLHIRLDTAILHSLLLIAPPKAQGIDPLADITCVQCVRDTAAAFGLHVAQYIDLCRDAHNVLTRIVERRRAADNQKHTESSRNRVESAADNAVSLGEESADYTLLERQHACADLLHFAKALGGRERLSESQRILINGPPLYDAVVGTMRLYGLLVTRFERYRHGAERYHQLREAHEALSQLAATVSCGGQLVESARELALHVGEAKYALDGLLYDLDQLALWVRTCAPDAVLPEDSPSQVGHRRTCRAAEDVFVSLKEACELLATLSEMCRRALDAYHRPVQRLIDHTLERHTRALLPLRQTTTALVAALREVEACLERELPHLRGIPRADASLDMSKSDALQWLLAPPATPATTPEPPPAPAFHAATTAQRTAVLLTRAKTVNSVIAELPAALANQLRVIRSPASLREHRDPSLEAAASLSVALEEEAAELSHHMEDAARSARAVTDTVPVERQVTPESLRHGIMLACADQSQHAADLSRNSGGGSGVAAGGIGPSSDLELCAALLVELTHLYAATEEKIMKVVLAESLVEVSTAAFDEACVAMSTLSRVVEALGRALGLDADAISRIGVALTMY